MNDLADAPRRGPGRPPKYHETLQAAPPQVEEPPVVVEDAPQRTRVTPNPFGRMKQKMAYEQRPGYHRHWFNESGTRISDAKDGGWEHVTGKDGKLVELIVGVAKQGGPQKAFLMEIPQDWYDEDMAAQQKIVNDKEEAMVRGTLEAQPGDGRYVPTDGAGRPRISIRHGR